ncbi:ankyrin repeat domain-containing protein [Andreprevotia lacus]|jgi:ankyrin repeat protein|nr:ankyrin repeat domain-containing protein [Andreprevotia lacus]
MRPLLILALLVATCSVAAPPRCPEPTMSDAELLATATQPGKFQRDLAISFAKAPTLFQLIALRDSPWRNRALQAMINSPRADLNQCGLEGITPLQLAIGGRNDALARQLLARGADRYKQDGTMHWNAIQFAALFERITLLQELVQRPEDWLVTDVRQQTLLHMATSPLVFDDNALPGDEACQWLGVLAQHGVPVNAAAEYGVTALMQAAQSSLPELVPCLLALGADPRMHDNKGRTAVQWALVAKKPANAAILMQAIEAETTAHDGLNKNYVEQ